MGNQPTRPQERSSDSRPYQASPHRGPSSTLDHVRRVLRAPLPGFAAQSRMAPAYRVDALRDRTPSPTAKEAAVLILLYERDGELWFPLTRRTETVESHKGQISLPGGAREDGDRSLLETALRETCEELAVCPEHCNVLGQLSTLYIPPSEFIISPYVAHTGTRPTFRPDPTEVAAVIETPLSLLLDPATVRWEEWTLRDTPVDVPFFDIGGQKVWGATAMVLSEFVTLLREVEW